MFGSTLILRDLAEAASADCPWPKEGRPGCGLCHETTYNALRYELAALTLQRDADRLSLYVTAMSMPQLRALFVMYPQLDCTSAAFDARVDERSLKLTWRQKRDLELRHRDAPT